MCDFVGHDADVLIRRSWSDLTGIQGRSEADAEGKSDVIAGRRGSYRTIEKYVHADGRVIWGDLTLSALGGTADVSPKYLLAQIADITSAVEMRDELAEARRQQATADALYRRSVESAKIGMALTQPDGGFTEVNDAMCEFFGYDAQTLLTKSWIELTAPCDRDLTLVNRDDLVAGRIESYRMHKQYMHADGHLIWGDLTVVCLRDDDGAVQTLISQIVDVTEEVAAHEEIEASRRQLELAAKRYRKLFDNSIIPAVLSRPDGSLAMVNQAMCDFLGYDGDAQPLTTSFAEYLLPTAPGIPRIKFVALEYPGTNNPLGVKGAGESGCIPVPGAVVSAIADAIGDPGVDLSEFPLTPGRLCELSRAASPRG